MTKQLPLSSGEEFINWATAWVEPAFQFHARHAYGCGSEVTTSAFLAVVEVCVEDSKQAWKKQWRIQGGAQGARASP